MLKLSTEGRSASGMTVEGSLRGKSVAMFRNWTTQWKHLTIKKILYLPRIMTVSEKRFFVLATCITLITGGLLFSRLYARATIPMPDVGGTYTEGIIGEPQIINPLYAARDTDRDLSRLMYAGLLTYNENGSSEPDLAESLDISEDGKVYTITLREKLKWHDGEPLTADDVLFTIHTIQNPEFRSPYRSNWLGVTVEKLNEKTIRFVLRAPYTPFVENLTLGIIPMHVWDTVLPEQMPLHQANLKPVGSGPYRFTSMEKNRDGSILRYTLSRNTDYHRDGPYIKTAAFVFFKDEEGLFSAWRKGSIDGFAAVPPERVKDINPTKNSLLTLNTPRVFGIFFNQAQAPQLANVAVRRAIAQALDKQRIADMTRSARSTVIDAPLPRFGNASNTPAVAFNPEAARQMLDAAQWTDDDGDGIRDLRSRENGKVVARSLRFTLTTSDWPDLVRTASQIQAMLKDIGIEIVIEKKSYSELESTVIRPRNYEILLFGQVYGYEPDPFAFWHSSQVKDPGLNIVSYMNKTTDKLLEDARKTADPAARSAIFRDFSHIIIDELPAVFLFTQQYLVLLPGDIQGANPLTISFPSDRFNQIHHLYRDTRRVIEW